MLHQMLYLAAVKLRLAHELPLQREIARTLKMVGIV